MLIPYDGSLEASPLNQGKFDDRKSKVIAFVVNAGMNVTADYFYI